MTSFGIFPKISNRFFNPQRKYSSWCEWFLDKAIRSVVHAKGGLKNRWFYHDYSETSFMVRLCVIQN
ncbi:hypothetical protein Hanom_Chr12g01137641 [Helianthus anomalus]